MWKSDSHQLVLIHWTTLEKILLKYQVENLTFAVSGCFRYQENHNSLVIKPKAKSPCQLHRVGGKGVCHWTEQGTFAEYSCLQVRLNFIFFPSSVIRIITTLPMKATSVRTELLQYVSSSVLRLPFPEQRRLKCFALSSFCKARSYGVPNWFGKVSGGMSDTLLGTYASGNSTRRTTGPRDAPKVKPTHSPRHQLREHTTIPTKWRWSFPSLKQKKTSLVPKNWLL